MREKRRAALVFSQTLLLLYFPLGLVNGQQRITEGPVETTVLVGGTVELRCRVEDQVKIFPKNQNITI